MKTPWRFLASLVSRKPTGAQALKPQDDLKALEYHPVDEEGSSPLSVSEVVAEVDDNSLSSVSGNSEPTVTLEETGSVLASDRASLSSSTSEIIPAAIPVDEVTIAAAPSPSQPIAAEPEDKARRQVGPTRKTTGANVRADESPSLVEERLFAPKTVLEEMSDLEQEIRILRRHLAEKLAQQNEQLQRMLKRYER